MFDTGHFQTHGYQVFEAILDPGVLAEVRAFLESQLDAQLESACAEIGCPSARQIVPWAGQRLAEDGAAFKGLSKGCRDTLSGHFSLAARLSPRLWAIPRQDRFRALLEVLLGDGRLAMHMPPAARFVLPGNRHAGVPPHQDISYNRHLSAFLTCWVPLVSIDDQCGGVAVYDGSGFEPERPVREDAGAFWLEPLATEGFREVRPRMEPGDVLMLNSTVIHRSVPNRSDQTRFSIDFRFFGDADTSTKHFLDLRTWRVVAPQGDEQHENL
jgi:ectoine hydroxylase-related dioxygenase (phytanoyl-CoA dioxygenase family)